MHGSPRYLHPHLSVTSDTTDEPTSTHHNETSFGGDADILEFDTGDECTIL